MSEKILVEKFIKNKIFQNSILKREVYVKASIADIIINDNIAIEAKLSNIKKALIQAVSYKTKYKYSYILLPHESKNKVKKWEELLLENNIRWMFMKNNGDIHYGKSGWSLKKIL